MYTLNPHGRFAQYLSMGPGGRHWSALPGDLCGLVWLTLWRTCVNLFWVAAVLLFTYTFGLGAYQFYQLVVHDIPGSFAVVVFLLIVALAAGIGLAIGSKALFEYRDFRRAVAYFTRHPDRMEAWWPPVAEWTWRDAPYYAINEARWGIRDEKREGAKGKEAPVIVTKIFTGVEFVVDVWNAMRQKACVRVAWRIPGADRDLDTQP